MRTKVTLALLFLNVALFFYIFKFEQPWQVEQKAQQASPSILGPEAANIQAIEISGADPAGQIALVRRGESWFLTKPFEWPANRIAVNSITNELQFLRQQASFSVRDLPKNNQTLAGYGLEPPVLTATFTSADPSAPRDREPAAGRQYTLALGNRTQDGNSFYLLSPDRQFVHVVGRSIVDSLSRTPAELRLDTLFTIPDFEARSLGIFPTGTMTAVRLRRDSDDRWVFESPIGNARADRNETRRFVNELGTLRARDFVATVPNDVANEQPARISLEGNGRSETLLLYKPVPAGRDFEYFARMESRNTFFRVTLPAAFHARMTAAQTVLRDRRVLDFEPRNVTKITIRAENREIELQRLEPATPTDPVSWRILGNEAATAGQSANADTAVVTRLLEQLTRLSALEFASDAPTARDQESWGFNIPARTITLAVSTVPGPGGAQSGNLTVQVGVDADRQNAYVRVAGSGGSESIYKVDPRILDETPVDPLAYRERLIRALPPSAQVGSLRIVDLLDNNRVVFDSAAAPSNPAAATVLAHLRTLRARSYVAGNFSEAENPAERKPWKFRLEATVSPPAGGGAAETLVLHLGERTGGNTQHAGSGAFNLVWSLEQPLVDALWQLVYGARDPGPTPPAPKQ